MDFKNIPNSASRAPRGKYKTKLPIPELDYVDLGDNVLNIYYQLLKDTAKQAMRGNDKAINFIQSEHFERLCSLFDFSEDFIDLARSKLKQKLN